MVSVSWLSVMLAAMAPAPPRPRTSGRATCPRRVAVRAGRDGRPRRHVGGKVRPPGPLRSQGRRRAAPGRRRRGKAPFRHGGCRARPVVAPVAVRQGEPALLADLVDQDQEGVGAARLQDDLAGALEVPAQVPALEPRVIRVDRSGLREAEVPLRGEPGACRPEKRSVGLSGEIVVALGGNRAAPAVVGEAVERLGRPGRAVVVKDGRARDPEGWRPPARRRRAGRRCCRNRCARSRRPAGPAAPVQNVWPRSRSRLTYGISRPSG